MSRLPNGRGPGRPKRPWEPSVRDLEIYAGLCEGRTTRDLGEEFGLHHSRIARICDQVDDWLIPQWMDHIRRIKARQTSMLTGIIREAFEGWERSQRDSESETVKDGKGGTCTTRTRKSQCGNPAFLAEIRAALADIRKIWGADAPVEYADVSDGERVAGRPRQDVIREQISKLRAALRPNENGDLN